MTAKQGRVIRIAAEQSDAMFQNLAQQGFAGVLEVDQVDWQPGGQGKSFDQCDLVYGLQWGGHLHGKVEIA